MSSSVVPALRWEVGDGVAEAVAGVVVVGGRGHE